MRVALYTRVSTEEQAKEGFSLPAQLDRLHAHAKAQGWKVIGEYVDEGQSGRTAKRPAYQHMLAEMDKWDTVLVLKMDRIHRNSRNFLAMMDDLQKHNKGFASVTENLDTGTAMGRFVMGVIQGIAQLESEQTGERVHLGMTQKAKSGKGSLGRPAPFGYAYGEDRKFVVIESEAVHIRWMFEQARHGVPKTTIAKILNDNGVRTRSGRLWTIWNVSQILDNPVYLGHLQWNGIVQENAHEAIVEES